MRFIILIVISIFFLSCKTENHIEKAIAKINTDIEIERFDKYAAKATLNDFSKLKKAYPFMFSQTDTDSTWRETKKDTFQLMLFAEVNKLFENVDEIEAEIESLCNHLKYYFSEFKPPRIITTTSYVDFRNRIFISDTISVIALDSYLGSDHRFYVNIQNYITSNMRKEQIVVDLATEYAKKYIYQKPNKTFLDEMIYFGKQLYFKDVILPFKTEAERISYSQNELDWAVANESYIWRYFVERELLFSTDSKLLGRFINPAPFSKFYLEEIDTDSPGRLGQYMGWQIIRAYMNNNNTSLKDMLIMPAEAIFNASKFKPRK